MSLDRSVTINLGGKERKIKFNALGVSQLERMLDDHNVYKMVNGGVVALGDLAKCLYVGLAAYDKKVTIQQVYNWMEFAGACYYRFEQSGCFWVCQEGAGN